MGYVHAYRFLNFSFTFLPLLLFPFPSPSHLPSNIFPHHFTFISGTSYPQISFYEATPFTVFLFNQTPGISRTTSSQALCQLQWVTYPAFSTCELATRGSAGNSICLVRQYVALHIITYMSKGRTHSFDGMD